MRQMLRFLCVRSRARSWVYFSFYNTCLLPVKVEFGDTIRSVKTRNKFRVKLFLSYIALVHTAV